jgi:hypothetical protein
MTEKTRKNLVYLVFVAALIYGAVNFLGSRGGGPVQSASQQQVATLQPLEPGAVNSGASADTSVWGRDPFARAVKTGPAAKQAETLRLSAISGSAEKPLAVINGKILGAGESIQGWQVIKVSGRTVQLRRNNENKTLTMGGS